MKLDAILYNLRQKREELSLRFGVVSAFVFGSTARGEETPNSDVDLALEIASPMNTDVMNLCAISDFLESHLNMPVDLVQLPAKDQALAGAIEKEGVLAF